MNIIRVINIDSYMSTPIQGLDVLYSEFRGSSINQVPIVRLFGSTGLGQKICLHIHGVFPYFYIPYDGTDEVNSLMYRIAANIDKAVNISLNQATSNVQHVYKILLVSGIPMYGYHRKEHQFLKIFLYNPLLIRRVSNLLANASTLGKLYQPFETHVPFVLQFMIDYNLHGMSNVVLSEIKFRLALDELNSDVSPEVTVKKVSVCELEGDAFAEHIINRLEVASGNVGANPGIAALWADETQRRRDKGKLSQIEHLLELEISATPTKSHSVYKQALLERLSILNEENVVTELNESVYPAETPENSNIQNASLIDSQCSSSLDDTIVSSGDLDDTITPLSETMDEEARNFLKILENLGAKANEDIEDDSILSQVVNDNEEDKEFDLSMPLESIMTPKKFIPEKDFTIPQLDGEYDDEIFDENCAEPSAADRRVTRSFKKLGMDVWISEQMSRKVPYVKLKAIEVGKKGRDMPLLDDYDLIENFNVDDRTQINKFKLKNLVIEINRVNIKNKVRPRKVKRKRVFTPRPRKKIYKNSRRVDKKSEELMRTEKELKSLEFHFKRVRREEQFIKTVKRIHEKNHKIFILLLKNYKPIFKVVPANRPVVQREPYKMNILSHIMLKTKNYIDPDLHLTIQYPTKERFLYVYRRKVFPKVYKIPQYQKFTAKTRKKALKNFVNRKLLGIVNKRKPNKNKLPSGDCEVLNKSIEFLQNNLPRFSSDLNTVLRNSDTVEQNQPCVHFPQEPIDSDNEKHCYIFSSKYLSNVSNNDLARKIENQTLSEIKETFKSIQEELKKHVLYLNGKTQSEKQCVDVRTVKQKQCLFLDGTVDSSSSEDEDAGILTRKRRNVSTANFSRYSALPVAVLNSPCTKSRGESADKHPVSQSTLKKCEETKTSVNVSITQTFDNNVKRKLKFSAIPSVHTTIIQEELVCKYSPRRKRSVVKVEDNQKTNFLQHDTTNISNSGHCDIFSNSDSDKADETSFFKSPEIAKKFNLTLSTAQKYDNETRYTAKEGTSKIITPQSSVSQKSLEEYVHSSGASSLEIPPYQPEVEEISHVTKPELSLNILTPVNKAPTRQEVVNNLDKYNIPSIKQTVPFYSNVEDVTGNVEVGYNVLKITSNSSVHLAEFESLTDGMNNFRKLKLQTVSSNLQWKKSNLNNVALSFCKDRDCILVPVTKPPTVAKVKNWIKNRTRSVTPEKNILKKRKLFIPLSPGNDNCDDEDDLNMTLTMSPYSPASSQATFTTINSNESNRLRQSLLLSQAKSNSGTINSYQITGIHRNTYSFDKSIQNLQAARAVVEHQNLTMLVVELHIQTRGEFKPNPEYDSIRAIFYSVLNDVASNHLKPGKSKGIIAINSLPVSPKLDTTPILDGTGVDYNIIYVDSEVNLLNEFLKLVTYWDPDIFAGYEIQMLSWGYLIDRASILGINIKRLLSRIKDDKKYKDADSDELQIVGRIILDIWRLMRHEVALQSYTFESIIYHILHRRVPQYSFKDLSFWWDHKSALHRHRTVRYYLYRVSTVLELLDKLDIIGRTSELARLFGIQFYEVLSRGSQFRVESMMLRLAKPLNFIPVSPSVQQRAQMKAPEYIPLVLEPESKLYNDPVIVLDFQSLYPSIIIAYNYCFTTCLGRVECLGKNTPFEFGAHQLKVSRKLLVKLLRKDLVNFSPCGVGFVKKEVRDGILPKMLREILDTRLMVKASMKENKDDSLLQKVLHNRQLGLKLIANVTYGYTAANFSGRMPSVEVGDSVVSKGRETLQRAIEMVDNTPEWGAKVVYGDTDSLFVLVPGKSRQHAFDVGKKIADAVTKANPDPVKLKLEKVYQPCILQTKKRYVGYMYESPEQKEPVYDAKGIETVRRDGCPAVSKMLEKCLRLLFETKDISLVKRYVLRQFNKIIAGRASIQDLTFAKEYRGASGYRPGACVPSLELARRWTAVDKRNEPRSGERVPYIIVNGPPGMPLIRLVKSPRDLLSDLSLRPNALYYITKVIIPPINRCFNLIGADVNIWFNQMPRKQIQTLPNSVSPGKKSTISQYFSTTCCVACGELTQTGICSACVATPQTTTIKLMEKLRNWERNNYICNQICQSCTGTQTEIKCVSLDCPVLYRRIQTNRDTQQAPYVRDLMSSSELF